MNDAKIQLSEDELYLALNTGWILTKNRIIDKVYQLFGALANSYQQHSPDVFSFLPVMQHAKITRGENYNGLPYVMLDYPRYFTRQDVLAVRTMFWWGNNMSITLHLKGQYNNRFGEAVTEHLINKGNGNWYLQTQGDEWLHHFSDTTHTALTETNRQYTGNQALPFVKLSSYLPLTRWNDAKDIFSENFRELAGTIKDQLPRR
ncbi:MAG: hypothetical protein KF862_02590 [Chitinophagaceae bacterium]|nr:hypothetical protein [Chitinophagaceae bacterium]